MPIRAIFFDVGETLIDETRLLHGWADTMGVGRAEFLAVLDDVIAKGENYRGIFERLRPGFDVRPPSPSASEPAPISGSKRAISMPTPGRACPN